MEKKGRIEIRKENEQKEGRKKGGKKGRKEGRQVVWLTEKLRHTLQKVL